MRAAVVEDQQLMRQYLAGVLSKHLKADAVIQIGSMRELAAIDDRLDSVDLILLDVDLGDGSTLDWAVDRVRSGKPGTLVVVSSINAHFPFRKLRECNISIAHKEDSEAELVDILKRALAGATVMSRKVSALLLAEGRDARSPMKLLGTREQQVLGLLGLRLSNEDIAMIIGSAPATVADHRKRIMRKLGLHTIEDVIDCAIRNGLVHDSTAAAAKARVVAARR